MEKESPASWLHAWEEEASTLIPFVGVAGFHHAEGNKMELIYPEQQLGEEWDFLPWYALPDGVHLQKTDFTYFDGPGGLYGVSCFMQISSEELQNKEDQEVTRSSVQKSVVALCALPLYGFLREKLEAATHAYFSSHAGEKQFSPSLLADVHASLTTSLKAMDLRKELPLYVAHGLNAGSFVAGWKGDTIALLKAVLLECKVVCFSKKAGNACTATLTLASLIPDLLPNMSAALLRAGDREFPSSPVAESLVPFTNSDVVDPPESGEQVLLLPFVGLQQLDELKKCKGFLCGATNPLFRELPAGDIDVIVHVDEFRAEFRDSALHKLCQMSTPDKRFVHSLLGHIGSFGDQAFLGSDSWVREEFRRYFCGLMADQPNGFNHHWVEKWRSSSINYARALKVRSEHSKQPHPSGPPVDRIDEVGDAVKDYLEEKEKQGGWMSRVIKAVKGTPPSTKYLAVALYDCDKGEDESLLEFRAGQRLEIVDDSHPELMKGRIEGGSGTLGKFPKASCRILKQ